MPYIDSTYFETETITTSIQSKSGLILITFKKNPPEMKGVDEFHIHIGSVYLTTKTDYQDALSTSLLYQHYDNESAIDDMNDRRNSIMKKVNEICHGPEERAEPPSDDELAEDAEEFELKLDPNLHCKDCLVRMNKHNKTDEGICIVCLARKVSNLTKVETPSDDELSEEFAFHRSGSYWSTRKDYQSKSR